MIPKFTHEYAYVFYNKIIDSLCSITVWNSKQNTHSKTPMGCLSTKIKAHNMQI